MKKGFVYILTNQRYTVYYVGVTNNIVRRMQEHKGMRVEGFSKRYNCTLLMHYEEYNNISTAIAREKTMKNWKREWKEELVMRDNPDRKDLASDW